MIINTLKRAAATLCCLPTLFILTGLPGNAQASSPTCTSAIVDRDGDGWGYEAGRSCKIADGHPPCSATATINGNWGYENGVSCTVQTQNNNGSRPTCSANAIDNGGGWGWENNTSCRWSGGASPTTNTNSNGYPTCSTSAANNGDGWGYENGQSCRFSDTNSNNNSGAPQCSVNATDNGDGWGFEQGQSCQWGNVTPQTDLDPNGAAPPPVAAAVPGYDNGSPICLTDSSDGNGDGFGYENERTCKVVSGVTATPSNPLLNTRWCQPWAEIAYGDYVLQNNTWNDSDVWTDNWSQCISVTGGPGNYIAKWDYNWLRRDEGNEYSVKSYPQVYYGRKTKNTQSGTPAKLGVPAPLNNIPDFKVRYKYSETGSPERNVALESFFHTSCEAEEWNKQFEMMIWVGKPNIRTPGTKVTEATIDGKVWDVYINPALGWGYVAFVVKQDSTEGWLDWNKFVNWTRYQGPQYGVWDIGANTCMGAIEIGTETFWGTGTFTLHEFRVTR